MAITDISIPLKYVFTQATEPNDKTEGKLWYNTSDNSLYTSDGTNYVKLGIDTTFFNEIFNNSLDILDIQAQETLDGGQSAYMVRDLFTDADGYLDSIDTGNTTATFNSNLYTNPLSFTNQENINGTSAKNTTNSFNINMTAKKEIVISKIYTGMNGTGTYHIKIVQNGNTLLDHTFNFISATEQFLELENYFNDSIKIGDFQIQINTTSASTYKTNSMSNTSLNNVEFTNQTLPCINDTGGYTLMQTKEANKIDGIIQSNKQDLNIEPSNFQVYAHKQTISGTGNITASVSFDNGANYQTVNLNTTTTITDKGDEMILKLNLNAGASNGLASCEGYGVMFW